MDLTKFKFPEVDNNPFSTVKTDKVLLQEAIDRKFYNGHTPYNKLFSSLFFSGGKVKFKKDIDEEFRKKAWSYCRSLMGSFEPKHEEKEAICSMLMSELLEIE
jgi:hypothetical protein